MGRLRWRKTSPERGGVSDRSSLDLRLGRRSRSVIIAIRDARSVCHGVVGVLVVVVRRRRFMVGGRGDGLVRGQAPSYLFRAKSLHNNVCGLGVGSHIQWISPSRQSSQSRFAKLVRVKSEVTHASSHQFIPSLMVFLFLRNFLRCVIVRRSLCARFDLNVLAPKGRVPVVTKLNSLPAASRLTKRADRHDKAHRPSQGTHSIWPEETEHCHVMIRQLMHTRDIEDSCL